MDGAAVSGPLPSPPQRPRCVMPPPQADLALLLALLGAHAQQPPQQEEVDLQLAEHVRQLAHLAEHLWAAAAAAGDARGER